VDRHDSILIIKANVYEEQQSIMILWILHVTSLLAMSGPGCQRKPNVHVSLAQRS
jgi:hypothetical protein